MRSKLVTPEVISTARKEINTLIQTTFPTLSKEDKDVFNFSIKKVSGGSLFDDYTRFAFKDLQEAWNLCYCKKIECDTFFKQARSIASKYEIGITDNNVYLDPKRLERDGHLHCK